MPEHAFEKSVDYDSKKGCPSGYHKRKGYTVKKTGTFVPARCIRSQSPYAETSAEFKARTRKVMEGRMKRRGKTGRTTRKCPKGYLSRKSYLRRFTSAVKQRGFTVKRKSGKVYKVYPKKNYTLVKSACIKDRGLPGKVEPGKQIGPLRKGELLKHGYVYRLPKEKRHNALRKAVDEFGALSVYRKLNAVAKLSVRTAPEASKAFGEDRDWIRSTYGPLKAF